MIDESSGFSVFNLAEPLLKALDEMAFKTPSPVQAQAIPLMLSGRDMIAQAQTGTGKTAAFALPILQRLLPHDLSTQALILAPTRELALQVAEQVASLSVHQKITVGVFCGGRDYRRELKQLREGAQVVVGTPGRILDHLERKTLKLNKLNTFVLDEADEMLRMGFIEDVETILSQLPDQKQIVLFSATMPPRIRHIAERYLNNPASVEIRMETATVKAIEQKFLFASVAEKGEALLRILAVEDYQAVIVFVRTKTSTEDVASMLQQQGHRAMAIHGDITQALREKIIAQFRQGGIDVLVATDVAARGLDVDRISHVINYDVPQDCETYVHRVGRTGRAGRRGVTILFITPKEGRSLNSIERHTRQRIEKITVPSNEAIQAAKQKRFLNNIHSRLQHEHLAAYQGIIDNFVKEQAVSAIDVAAALALLLNQDKPWRCDLPKMARAVKESPVSHKGFKSNGLPQRKAKISLQKNYPQEVFRLDVGRIHGVKAGNIVGAIANEAGLESRYITGLKIHDDHSIVHLPQGMPKEVFQDLNRAWVCGRQLKLKPVSRVT